jgi:hypothetical protein
VWTTAVFAADSRDPLDRARALYNQRQFEAAVNAADEARKLPQQANGADLIAARAYLERFRESSSPDDLVHARERLRGISPDKFSPRERIEFIVGLGETLYFEGSSGAAAAVFESVLMSGGDLADAARERVLDCGPAPDRDARPRPDRAANRLPTCPRSKKAGAANPKWATAHCRGRRSWET